MTKSLRLNFESSYAVHRKNYCHTFDSKGLEDKRRHGMCNLIVTVRRVYGSDSSRSARLAGNIIKQRFRQNTIIGSAILLAENFLRDEFKWSCIVQHPNAVYLFVHCVEVCLH